MNKKNGAVVLSSLMFTLLVVIIFLSRNESTDSQKATKIYFADNISPAHLELIDSFNKKYKDKIEVISINLPFSKFSTNERKQLLTRTLRTKSDRIDIFSVDLIWIPRFNKWAEPLDLYFTKSEMNKIISYAKTNLFYNERLVALPFYMGVGVMYYRDDMIKDLPDYKEIKKKIQDSITWEEFIHLSNRLKDKTDYTYMFAADSYEGLISPFFELLHNKSNSVFTRDSVQLNTPAIKEALQFMVDLIHKYKIVPFEVTSFKVKQCYEYAIENDVPFLRGWPGTKKQYSGTDANYEKLNHLEIAPLPHVKGHKASATFGGWNLMISRNSKHKAEAVAFIRFLLERKNQELLFKIGGYLPVLSELYHDPSYLVEYPILKEYLKIFDFGLHRPMAENYTKLSDIISYYINLALKGEVSVEVALKEATDRINSQKILIK